MPSFEYIDSYFKGDLRPEEKKAFDDRITADESFAEEVAFYLSTLEAARTELAIEKKNRFRELYPAKPVAKLHPVRTIWQYAAAAVVIIITIVGAYFILKPADTGRQLAAAYIADHFNGMSVQMDDKQDAVQAAKALFNDGKYAAAQQHFDRLLQANPADDVLLQLAGISALKAGNYQAAAIYFSRLQEISGLHANYGKFYHGITLLTWNRPGDLEAAKKLLQQVIAEDLAGKEDATAMLKHL